VRPGAGSVLFFIGLIGTLAGVLQRLGAPVPYFAGEWMLILLCLATTIVGASLTWRDDHPRTEWSPSHPGRRFASAVLYTRKGCHLCDEAQALLARYADYLPEAVAIDIDEDPELQAEYDECVPVIVFDGRERFRGVVSESLLRRLIDGTPPLSK
jgi:glutaredoxin